MTAKPQVKFVDALTGEEIIRDANAEELAQIESDNAVLIAKIAKIKENANTKAALLERLGITEDEAKLLLS